MDENQLVFVTGMGRSGTSVFCNWLQTCGVDFGTEVSTVEHINPTGNFEDQELMDFHVDLYHANGQKSWLDVPLDFQWKIPEEFHQRGQAIAEKLRSGDSPKGVKNPLATSFLPFWNELLPKAQFMFVYRDVNEVVDSARRLRRRTQSARRNRLAGTLRRIEYATRPAATRRDQHRALTTWLRCNGESARFLLELPRERVLTSQASDWPESADRVFDTLNARLGDRLQRVPMSDILVDGYLLSEPPPCPEFSDLRDKQVEVEQQLDELVRLQAL